MLVSICGSCGADLERIIWVNRKFKNLHTNQIVSNHPDKKPSRWLMTRCCRFPRLKVRERTPTTVVRCQISGVIDGKHVGRRTAKSLKANLIWRINSERCATQSRNECRRRREKCKQPEKIKWIIAFCTLLKVAVRSGQTRQSRLLCVSCRRSRLWSCSLITFSLCLQIFRRHC